MGQATRIARYPLHWHLAGDVSGSGSYLRNNSIHESYQRCVTLHGTWGALVEVVPTTARVEPPHLVVRSVETHLVVAVAKVSKQLSSSSSRIAEARSQRMSRRVDRGSRVICDARWVTVARRAARTDGRPKGTVCYLTHGHAFYLEVGTADSTTGDLKFDCRISSIFRFSRIAWFCLFSVQIWKPKKIEMAQCAMKDRPAHQRE